MRPVRIEILDPVRAAELVERVELRRHADELEHHGVRAEVEHAAVHRLGHRDQLRALVGGCADLDEQQLALDRLVGDELGHAQDVDELVDLLLDLLERVLGAVDAHGDARDAGALGRADGERVDVEPAAREHRRDPRERSGLVLDGDGDGAFHCDGTSASVYSSMSSAAAPAGIIGKHCSAGSTRTSITTGRPQLERLLERRPQLLLLVHGDPDRSVGLCELRVVGHRLGEVDVRAAAVEEHVLPLGDHPQVAVVEEQDDDREVVEDGGDELLGGHLEAAVAVDADHRRLGPRRLGADRGRDPVAHRPEPAGGDEVARPLR